MTTTLFLIAVALLFGVSIWFAVYRVGHPYTREDVKQERKDAATHSRAVTGGKAAEHLVAVLPEFAYHARDARFLGDPIDYVIFDGLTTSGGKEIERIVLLEVKTGTRKRLTAGERAAERAVHEHVRISSHLNALRFELQPPRGCPAREPRLWVAWRERPMQGGDTDISVGVQKPSNRPDSP